MAEQLQNVFHYQTAIFSRIQQRIEKSTDLAKAESRELPTAHYPLPTANCLLSSQLHLGKIAMQMDILCRGSHLGILS